MCGPLEGPRVCCIVLGLHCNTAGRALDYPQGAAAKAAGKAQARRRHNQRVCPDGVRNAPRRGPASEHATGPRAPEPQTPARHTQLHADAHATSNRSRTPRYMLCQQTRWRHKNRSRWLVASAMARSISEAALHQRWLVVSAMGPSISDGS